jgi:peptide/nickel transport system substrate-binding protein
LSEYDKRSADMMMFGWHADTEDSANFVESLATCRNEATGWGRYNASDYCNPKLDALMTRANVETDVATRTKLLQDAERLMYEDAPFIPLHWQDQAWAARKNIHIEPVLNVLNLPYLGDLVVD